MLISTDNSCTSSEYLINYLSESFKELVISTILLLLFKYLQNIYDMYIILHKMLNV